MGPTDKERRLYPAEFKAEAAVLAGKHKKPVRQVAADLVINENMLHRWIQQPRTAAGTGLPLLTRLLCGQTLRFLSLGAAKIRFFRKPRTCGPSP
jgi:transposase-like protein